MLSARAANLYAEIEGVQQCHDRAQGGIARLRRKHPPYYTWRGTDAVREVGFGHAAASRSASISSRIWRVVRT
jgi:hypothetical protein